MVQAPCRPSKIKPKWDQSIQKITHPSGRPGVWQGNLKRGIYAPPPIEPAHPYSLGLLITLVGRMLPFSLSIFLNWSSPDHLWSSWSSWSRLWWSLKRFNLLACDRIPAHYLQSSSSCSGWWSFEISGLPTKMIGSRRLFLPRSLGHIQLCSQVKRSFKCTVNPLMFELQGSKIWTIWPKWQPGTNWFGAFSKWKQVDWTNKCCWFDVYARGATQAYFGTLAVLLIR